MSGCPLFPIPDYQCSASEGPAVLALQQKIYGAVSMSISIVIPTSFSVEGR